MIKSAFTKVEKWAYKNSIMFDSNKFKTINFLYKKVFLI